MKILAIDPGPYRSAWCLYDTESREPWEAGESENASVREMVRSIYADAYVIERVQSFLTRVGTVVFDTQWEAALIYARMPKASRHWLTRPEVKRRLLGKVTGNDADIRAALIDRFGPTRREAVGVKAAPGPCYRVKRDMWAALAVAAAWSDGWTEPSESQPSGTPSARPSPDGSESD